MILEAVICAALLIAVVIGVGAAIDGASAGSARDKARSVAAMLAEQDQERMRGMRPANLANYSATRTVTVDGAAYTVASSGDWVSDATGGTESCTMESRNADYLRIRSTVTSNIVGRQTRPVVLQSLVAPPVGTQTAGQGTLGVQVNDRNGAPVPNASVTITGSHTYSDLTSSVGCAIFANVPSGTYGVNLTHSGYVDPSGDAESTGTVSAGVTNVTSIRFDRAAQIHVGFITTIEGVDVRVRG